MPPQTPPLKVKWGGPPNKGRAKSWTFNFLFEILADYLCNSSLGGGAMHACQKYNQNSNPEMGGEEENKPNQTKNQNAVLPQPPNLKIPIPFHPYLKIPQKA